MKKMMMGVLGGVPSGGLFKPKPSSSITLNHHYRHLLHCSPPPSSVTPSNSNGGGRRRLMRCLHNHLSFNRINSATAGASSSSFSYSHRHSRRDKGWITTLTTSLRNADTDTASPAQQAEEEEEEDELGKANKVKETANTLDIRVGKIIVAYKHPEADSLYVEEVDVGEPEPRIICSGLVNFIPINDLQHLRVVVLANLKPRNMRGVRSYGMLMAASDAEHENVELLIPPENSVPGERIWFGSEDEKETLPDVASPNQIQKKKIWELVQPHLKTDDSCIAGLGSHAMRTTGGVVVAKSLKNARIS